MKAQTKKKPHLTLNLFQEPQTNSEREPVSTPTNKLDSLRVKLAFSQANTGKEFVDSKGEVGIEYSNHYLLKFQQPITPGAHAQVQKEQLVSPGGKSSLSLVGKCGTDAVASEIKIYQLIASHPKSTQKAILQPLFTENRLYKHTLHFPLMLGGNLKKQQSYLSNKLANIDARNVAPYWLYKQIITLLEALKHLHMEKFCEKNKHYKGIVHGDIKLDNILINASGDLILADFGCAYPASEPAKQLGSIRYSAPEIFANDDFIKSPIKDIEKSDSWALGIVLCCLLMNKFPNLTSTFSEVKTNPKKSSYLNHRYILDSKKCLKQKQMLFFEDGINGFFYRKKWGRNFPHSALAKQAREAMARLNHYNYQLLALNQRSVSILSDLSLSLLLPVEERLSATALLKLLKKLAPRFTCSSGAYQAFISDLLAQSSLNQNTNHRFPSPTL